MKPYSSQFPTHTQIPLKKYLTSAPYDWLHTSHMTSQWCFLVKHSNLTIQKIYLTLVTWSKITLPLKIWSYSQLNTIFMRPHIHSLKKLQCILTFYDNFNDGMIKIALTWCKQWNYQRKKFFNFYDVDNI